MADIPRLTPNDRIKLAVQIWSSQPVVHVKHALEIVKQFEQAYDQVYGPESNKTLASH